tara:strand:+ start:342 stop:770 length:429 start_codon:yes stop_codon:yes gene_type:complete
MTFKYKQVTTIAEIIEAIRLRIKVFCIKQGIKPLIEIDEHDKNATHFIAINKGKVIGTARTRILNKKSKIERIVINQKFRNKGIGTGLVKIILNFLKRKNISKIYLHAQYRAKNFYEKIGFKAKGKPFNEDGIKHIKMIYKN